MEGWKNMVFKGEEAIDGGVNPRAFKSIMTKVWNVKEGVDIRDIAHNLFTFWFMEKKDM